MLAGWFPSGLRQNYGEHSQVGEAELSSLLGRLLDLVLGVKF